MANGETYVEWLVKRQGSFAGKALKGLAIVGLVLSIFLMFFIQGMLVVGFIMAIVFGVLMYFANLNAEIEYEYLYLDREITVDKIMAQTKRKKVAKFNLEKMEIFAPINSHQLDSYKNRNLKSVDYSSGVEQKPDPRYIMVYGDEGGTKLVVLEPNEAMVKAIKTIAPRKVFND